VRLARLRQRLPELFCAEPCQTVKKTAPVGEHLGNPDSGAGEVGGGELVPRGFAPPLPALPPAVGGAREEGRQLGVGRRLVAYLIGAAAV
jgi:hypothetical protein